MIVIHLSYHCASAMDEIVGHFDDLELQQGYCNVSDGAGHVLNNLETKNDPSSEATYPSAKSVGVGDDKGKLPASSDLPLNEDTVAANPGNGEGHTCEAEGDMTCAICLGEIPLEDLAMVKGCDHIYCAQCILKWTLHKETCLCPQCKQEFSYLMTYRALDGSLNDFPMEESVVLLRRARWFEDSLKDDSSKALLDDVRHADEVGWQDYYEDEIYTEDEEMEAFYFSSAAGKARIVLGNRRFGQGGYISSGYRQARPVKGKKSSAGGSSSGKGKAPKGKVPKSDPAATPAIKIRTPNANGGKSVALPASFKESFSDTGTPSPLLGTSPSGCGRRARRSARKAALGRDESSDLTEPCS